MLDSSDKNHEPRAQYGWGEYYYGENDKEAAKYFERYINYIDNDLDKPIRVHHNPDRVVNLMSSRVEILWNTEYEYVESDLSLSIRDIRMREYSKEECYHSSFFIFSIFHAYFH